MVLSPRPSVILDFVLLALTTNTKTSTALRCYEEECWSAGLLVDHCAYRPAADTPTAECDAPTCATIYKRHLDGTSYIQRACGGADDVACGTLENLIDGSTTYKCSCRADLCNTQLPGDPPSGLTISTGQLGILLTVLCVFVLTVAHRM